VIVGGGPGGVGGDVVVVGVVGDGDVGAVVVDDPVENGIVGAVEGAVVPASGKARKLRSLVEEAFEPEPTLEPDRETAQALRFTEENSDPLVSGRSPTAGEPPPVPVPGRPGCTGRLVPGAKAGCATELWLAEPAVACAAPAPGEPIWKPIAEPAKTASRSQRIARRGTR
jgi:hypothetical protein